MNLFGPDANNNNLKSDRLNSPNKNRLQCWTQGGTSDLGVSLTLQKTRSQVQAIVTKIFVVMVKTHQANSLVSVRGSCAVEIENKGRNPRIGLVCIFFPETVNWIKVKIL